MKTGIADLPLHSGKCPAWLFRKMKELGKAISEAVVLEFGETELIKRLSDPFFFQSLACVLGFDWHSSGTTTTVCGALKEVLPQIGIGAAGGKGMKSFSTAEEIEKLGEELSLSSRKIEGLKYASRMAAKVDSACVQDGYRLYHHAMFFTEKGEWCVVQQGMNTENRYARRYHWFSGSLKNFVIEPHTAVCCDAKHRVLNLVAFESEKTRRCSVEAASEGPRNLKFLSLLGHHEVRRVEPVLRKLKEDPPSDFEQLVSREGVGEKTLRALALISKIVYGTEPSWRDPVKYSFAHGGKDGHPYPVDRKIYDKSVEILRTAIENAKIGNKEKLAALRKLGNYI
ncbi:MAG: DUF763 domain-containing protein [Candidatus Micrarchaeota archaeon]|nr:DUF763 domain-containing protein [Candidatus Micrarchaeota archaeon]